MKGYKKVIGRSSTAVQKVYLGEHDVLIIDGTWIEEYRRIPYTDITAVVWSQTQARMAACVLSGSLFLLFLLFRYAADAQTPINAFFCGALLFVLLYSVLKGGTVKCALRSRVQQVNLKSTNRMPRLRKLLRELEPRIEEAQGRGPLTAEEVREHHKAMQERATADRRGRASAARQGQTATPPPLPTAVPPPLPTLPTPRSVAAETE